MSTVSVIIPCYNYGRYLRQCVDSVLSQAGVKVEVLVIDDASADETWLCAGDCSRRDERVQVRRHERNIGHIATYNEGLEWAEGDYLLLLSADDYLTPGSLARATALMDTHPNVGLVYGRALPDGAEATRSEPATPGRRDRVMSGRAWIEERCYEMNNVVPTPTAVVRTTLQHAVGGYRRDSPYAGDLEMWLRLAAHADVGELDAEQAIYRQHGRNMSQEWFSRLTVTFEHSRRAYETVLTEHAQVIPEAPRLIEVVRREVARRALRMATNRYCRGPFDLASVRWLESHAADVYPPHRQLPEWWTLQVCKLVGAPAAEHFGPAVDRLRAGMTWCRVKLGHA
jgi:glycosyltransferase involved in cell wall biosynthesis